MKNKNLSEVEALIDNVESDREVLQKRVKYRKALNALARIALSKTSDARELRSIADLAMCEINPVFSEWRV